MATIEELAAKVAELEQQMAAITAPPTEYYTSAYSGEEIDAAVKKVSEGLAGGVASFNGRTGAVLPQSGDYTAAMVGSAPAQNDSDYSGCYYRMNGAAKEWINPPMQLGVEYRTTERYSNKPVFVMAVDGGVFPNSSSKTIDVQIPDASGRVKMLDCYGVLDNGTQIPGLFGESVFDASNYLGLFTQNGNGKFTISVGSGRTVGLNFTLFLKYWKEGT